MICFLIHRLKIMIENYRLRLHLLRRNKIFRKSVDNIIKNKENKKK